MQEIIAILLAMDTFADLLANRSAVLYSDNKGELHYSATHVFVSWLCVCVRCRAHDSKGFGQGRGPQQDGPWDLDACAGEEDPAVGGASTHGR